MAITELAVVADTAERIGTDDTGVDGVDGGDGGVVTPGVFESVTDGSVAMRRNQRGMVSAEWAVGIIAAVALAGVLIAVITNGPVQDALLKFVLEVIHSFSGYVR